MTGAVGAPVPVFFISDNTGVTAETLGNALLAHFPGIRFLRRTFPFVDSPPIAQQVLSAARTAGPATLLLVTVRAAEVSAELSAGPFAVVDLIKGHLTALEKLLGVKGAAEVAPHHSIGNLDQYSSRMRAVEYTLTHDDAAGASSLVGADLIIIAPSRCGKTPTALYLALQHGLRVANYPLTEEDYPALELPRAVEPYRVRCFGLTSTAQRLSQIRQERRPGGAYASLFRCRQELRWAESLYRRHSIPSLNTAARSVEEIAAAILQTMHLRPAAAPSSP
ncbi:pyruvate, phosphate dikinase/phosphoenolpyruvate synthase regulator [Nesterenkonia sp. LB17]|uniref:pyruvate, water dikinase regulatory protein n=1 Tax=Nesterenkonia sp. LB17 TaxID=2901230 RepID=UPI001F4D0803|nr:pyruvate, phosphate dikinase/phosphoenolpyruvate synthase regulator [Nesterenkonia sp. LB17]MCH8566427.1 pyruvate, phosphate dikinase/phosphoenolpyruvate synthase regulator [Nesterenkonia sp. LB17]